MRRTLRVLIISLAIAFLIATALPWIRTGEWWVRLFDFPRVQLSVLGILALLGVFALWPIRAWATWILGPLLVAGLAFQAVRILPFTPLWSLETPHARADAETVSILIANVLQSNRESQRLIERIRANDPDLILLVETNAWWIEQLRQPLEAWPHRLEVPRADGYGMLALSRLPWSDAKVRYVVSDDRPSLRATVHLPSGRSFQWFGLHPPPPGHETSERRFDSRLRDAEILLIAKEVHARKGPALVCGDLNDVAWSHTTRLAKRMGGLLDPRVGRGFFNSYHADYFFLRYPIDQILLTADFAIADLCVLPAFGSDHFAVAARVALTKTAAPTPQPVDDDRADAREMIDEGQADSDR